MYATDPTTDPTTDLIIKHTFTGNVKQHKQETSVKRHIWHRQVRLILWSRVWVQFPVDLYVASTTAVVASTQPARMPNSISETMS